MLNLVQDIKSVSYIKSHAAEMLRQIGENRNPVIITQNGEAKAVLLNVETYQSLIDSLGILKLVSIGDNQIANKKTIKHDSLKKKINSLLK